MSIVIVEKKRKTEIELVFSRRSKISNLPLHQKIVLIILQSPWYSENTASDVVIRQPRTLAMIYDRII